MWSRFLNSRWCIPLAALVGMLLVAPSVNMGLMGDDYLHWSLLTAHTRHAQPGSPFGLFTFADGNAQANQAMKDNGQLVWWAADQLKISFWRPLAEWSQRLDYVLWPDAPVLMHLHNLLLYGLMVLLIGRLFNQLFNRLHATRGEAGLATLLFAGNMLHVFAVAWLASRNQMLAGVLLVLTLLAYHRWRAHGEAAYGVAAALCLGLGLLSAEAAVQTMGYLVAYAVFMEGDRPITSRFKALLPFIVLVLVWKAAHGHLGYGSTGSPGYIDPSANPGRFLGVLVLRLPVLMAAQWLGVSSMMFEQLGHGTQIAYAAIATAALLLLAFVVQKLGVLRSALARFYLAGAILSLIPACAGYPFDRLTVNADIGVSGLLAMVLMAVWARRAELKGWPQGWMKGFLYLIGAVHLVLFPVGKLASSVMMKPLNSAGEDLAALALPDPALRSAAGATSGALSGHGERFVLLNAPSGEAVYYFPLTRQYHGRANPEAMYALGPNNQPMTLTRVDERSLRLAVPSGWRGTIARDIRLQPFHAGDTGRMAGIDATVEAVTPDGVPSVVLFRFPDALDAPHWRFFAWHQQGVQALALPAVGQSTEIAGYDISQAVADYLKRGR